MEEEHKENSGSSKDIRILITATNREGSSLLLQLNLIKIVYSHFYLFIQMYLLFCVSVRL